MFRPGNIRLATAEERDFYENRLYPLQDEVLKMVKSDAFYLTGGTALSRFHLKHRYSDDLDIFYHGHHSGRGGFGVEFVEIIQRISSRYTVREQMESEFFKRVSVTDGQVELKLEFVYDPHERIGEMVRCHDCLIDTIENIGTNKMTAVQDRKTAKDFVDLYFILQQIDFKLLAGWASKKIVPLDYEGTVMAFAGSRIDGTAVMIESLALDQLERFGESLVSRIFDNARAL